MQLADSSSTAFAHTFFAAANVCSYPQPLSVSAPVNSDRSVAMDLPGFYESGGKTYRQKICPDVNANHAIEDVQEYVRSLPTDAVVYPHDPEKEVPYESVADYICMHSQTVLRAGQSIRVAERKYVVRESPHSRRSSSPSRFCIVHPEQTPHSGGHCRAAA